MSIVQPAQAPWRTPPTDPPPVGVEVTRYGDGDVTARLGAGPADLAAALTRIPAQARLTGAHFDADLTLLFRTDPPESTHAADHELTVAPGATAAELAARLLAVPAGAVFTDHYGDVDLTVVFRQLPPPPE